jgi:DNA-binding MarR family transcriptional regulator
MNPNPSTSSTSSRLALSTESTTKDQFQVDEMPSVRRTRTRAPLSRKNVLNAVYAHIRAIRALGRTEVNTSDIAEALSLPVAEVNRAVSSLKKKGVKASNG